MPPKARHRPYRKRNQETLQEDKPVVFGPEPPPPPPPPSPPVAAPPPRPASPLEAEPSVPTTAQQAPGASATTTEATAPEAASTEEVRGQADTPPGRSDRGGGRGKRRSDESGLRGRGRGRAGKTRPKKRIDDEEGGWNDDRLERPLHETDLGRYSEDLPWDLRLLRCCDEFRSLRSLGIPGFKVNYDSVLRYFQANVTSLRNKYGRQPLRGFDPDVGLKKDADQNEDDKTGGSDDDASDASVEGDPELYELTEQEWAARVFKEKRLAKFFSNRSADNYTPTLWIAPKIMKNLLRFMLQRRVFPKHQPEIEALLPVCNTAQAQLLPASRILKQICGASLLLAAVQTLFPDTSSTLASPVVVNPDPGLEEPVDLPDMFSNVSLAGGPESDEEEIADRFAPISKVFTWATESNVEKDDAAKPKDPEEAMRAHADRIKQQFEEDAQRIDAWTKPLADREPATSILKTVLGLIRRDQCESEGIWRVGARERSARPIESWKSLGLAPFRSTSKRLVELALGSHETDFPLTSLAFPPPAATIEAVSAVEINSPALAHGLATPITLLVDLALTDTVPDDLHAVRTAVLEADLVQLVFVPSSESDDSHLAVRTLWCIERLYRVVPAYWRHAGELLRLEPGQQMSFPGPYAPIRPDVLARIMELPASESEPEDVSGGGGAPTS